MEGIIYLLSNPAMRGIIKIRKPTKEDVKLRMKELYSSGVPFPIECEYAALENTNSTFFFTLNLSGKSGSSKIFRFYLDEIKKV